MHRLKWWHMSRVKFRPSFILSGDLVERRTAIIPVKGRKLSLIRRLLQRHPMVRTILLLAVLALAGALINWLTSTIPGNSSGSNLVANPNPVIQVPDTFASAQAAREQSAPAPSPAPSYSAAAQQEDPYSKGSCLAGNFTGSSPKDVRKVSCSSSKAKYQVVGEFPGATDPSVCQDVSGAEFGYLEQYLENEIPVESYVYCLGAIG